MALPGRLMVTPHEQTSSAAAHGEAGEQGEEGEVHSGCDHCCHASAHLTGMWADQPDLSIPDTNSVWPRYHKLYYSISGGPPHHPPHA